MTRRVLFAALFLSLSLAPLAGCRERSAAPERALPAEPEGPIARPGERLLLKGAQHHFELELRPAVPPLGELFEVVTTVRDAKTGERVRPSGGVIVDATMPHHGHGMTTRPVHTALEDGRFHTRGMRLHMGGRWLLTVEADGDRAEIVWEQPR